MEDVERFESSIEAIEVIAWRLRRRGLLRPVPDAERLRGRRNLSAEQIAIGDGPVVTVEDFLRGYRPIGGIDWPMSDEVARDVRAATRCGKGVTTWRAAAKVLLAKLKEQGDG